MYTTAPSAAPKRTAVRYAAAAALCAGLLAGCGDPAKDLAKAEPAAGASLEEMSREIRHDAQISKVAALVQRFCRNMSGAACPPDTTERLKPYGFTDGNSGVALAHAFVKMAADAKDGVADQQSNDEDFISAAYRVAFAREPDPPGAQHYAVYLKKPAVGGVSRRDEMIVILIQSPEFQSLR
jgi:hypothetical protein